MSKSIKLDNDTYWDSSAIANHTISIGSNRNKKITYTGVVYDANPIPLDRLISKCGSCVTFENNAIKINENGYYIVSGNILAKTSSTGKELVAKIKRNNSDISCLCLYVSSTGWYSLALTPMLIYLNAGDIIYLCVGANATNIKMELGSYNYTYLTIKKI